MGKDLNPSAQATLESLVDAHGLSAVLQSLSSICDAKSDHIRANGTADDILLAKIWAKAGGVIGLTVCNRYVNDIGEP